jgi:uncharacterized damage-inducible protein DinB
MKELLKQFAAYNIWATRLLVDCIKQLSDEEITAAVASSFPSLYKTVQHMWLAEEVWWQRMKLVENIELQSQSFTGNFTELAAELAKQSLLWKTWIDEANDNQLTHVFAFVRNKEQHKMPVYQMIHHVLNHGTYHRGQLVTILRQLGVTKIPGTDFSTFIKGK